MVGDVEERPGAPGDQHRGDRSLGIERTDAVHEGSDRFAISGDEPAHAVIADHEVRRGGVLVDQQRVRAGLERLCQPGGLRGGAGGVGGGEPPGVGTGGQVADERGDVHPGDCSAVLGPDGDGVGAGEDPFTSVPGHMRVDSALDGAQQRRLAVVAAADDHGDAFRDPHAGDPWSAGHLEADPQRVGRVEPDRVLGVQWKI